MFYFYTIHISCYFVKQIYEENPHYPFEVTVDEPNGVIILPGLKEQSSVYTTTYNTPTQHTFHNKKTFTTKNKTLPIYYFDQKYGNVKINSYSSSALTGAYLSVPTSCKNRFGVYSEGGRYIFESEISKEMRTDESFCIAAISAYPCEMTINASKNEVGDVVYLSYENNSRINITGKIITINSTNSALIHYITGVKSRYRSLDLWIKANKSINVRGFYNIEKHRVYTPKGYVSPGVISLIVIICILFLGGCIFIIVRCFVSKEKQVETINQAIEQESDNPPSPYSDLSPYGNHASFIPPGSQI